MFNKNKTEKPEYKKSTITLDSVKHFLFLKSTAFKKIFVSEFKILNDKA